MANPKKTAQRRKLEGDTGHRPETVPVVAPGMPDPPAWLKGAALEEWRRIAGLLDKLGLLSPLDRAPLADYCRTVANLDRMMALIERGGFMVRGRHRGVTAGGEPVAVKHPLIPVANQYRAALQRYAALFGLAAGPRGRMNMPEADNDDDPYGLLD